MGRSTTPRYIIRKTRTRETLAIWDTTTHGRPTPANLEKYRQQFNASLQPGQPNEHLGNAAYLLCGMEIYNQHTGTVTCQISPPLFELIDYMTSLDK